MNCQKCGRDVAHLPRYSRTHDNGETWDGPYCYLGGCHEPYNPPEILCPECGQ